MARLRDVPHGKVIQFEGLLGAAGLDEELVDLVNREPHLAEEWLAKLRGIVTRELFRTPEQLFETFWRLCHRRAWSFTNQQIQQLQDKMPVGFVSSLDRALSLEIWLGDLNQTVVELSAQAELHSTHDYVVSSKPLRLHPAHRSSTVSVRWVVLNLLSNRGLAPQYVPDIDGSQGLAVLAAAVLHPRWPGAINHDSVPAVWLPGIDVNGPGDAEWQLSPRIQIENGAPVLAADWKWRTDKGFAVPTLWEM